MGTYRIAPGRSRTISQAITIPTTRTVSTAVLGASDGPRWTHERDGKLDVEQSLVGIDAVAQTSGCGLEYIQEPELVPRLNLGESTSAHGARVVLDERLESGKQRRYLIMLEQCRDHSMQRVRSTTGTKIATL